MVMMMGRWSAGSCDSVRQVVVWESVGEQNVMSGDEGERCAWCGMYVCCEVSLSMYMLSNCTAMSRPRRLLWLCSYQAVSLALKCK